jgi:oligopeptide/dipeptide ABC transporter ATP-binding protein
MYLGHIVEEGAADQLFAAPRHPYTRLLLAAAAGMSMSRRTVGQPANGAPDAFRPSHGCRFHPRCPVAIARCSVEVPRLVAGKTGIARCLRDDGDGAPEAP